MFDEIPEKYVDTPMGTPQVRNYKQMLLMLNRIIQRAPEFNTTGLVGTPINAILDYPMVTKAGYVFFMNPKINEKLRDILNYWGKFLQTPDSTYVLNASKNGCLSDYALNEIAKVADGDKFTTIFKCASEDRFYLLGQLLHSFI